MSNKDENEELDLETFGCTDADEANSLPITDNQCDICRGKLTTPRVLHCLHVFCEGCLQTLLDGDLEKNGKNHQITCPTCNYITKMDGKPASNLLMAFVNANILDMESVHSEEVVCTSCKSEEIAVARCADCANFLCPNCNLAHQVMRCFENHHVLTLEELKESTAPIPIHKPVACSIHPAEIVKFFCVTCQVPTCGECISEHKLAEHTYQRVAEADTKVRDELREMVQKAKERVQASDEACNAVMGALSELEAQKDSASSLIEETFQSYKAVLDKVRDKSLDELKQLANARELCVMEKFKSIDTAGPHIEMAIAFTNALIELGDPAEVLSSHRVVRDRLRDLLSTPLDPHVDVDISFETNIDDFTNAIERYFGTLKTADTKKSETPPPSPNPISPPPPTSLPPLTIGDTKDCRTSVSPMASNDTCGLSILSSSIMSIPTSGIMSSSGGDSPTSLKSSCDSDLSNSLSSPFNLHPGLDIVTPPLSQAQTPPPFSGLSPLVEYNLQQLASLEPSNQLCLADLLTSDLSTANHAMNNIQALAKLNVSNGTIGDYAANIMDPVQNGLGLGGVNGSPYSNLSSHTSPRMQDLSGMNGVNGYNGMNGYHDMNRMNNVANGMNGGMHGMSPVPSFGGMNQLPAPRQSSSNSSVMTVQYKYGQLGSAKGQFNSPHGFCLGNDEEVIVADTNNHRIQIFEKDGSFKYQFGVAGREEGQLWYPRKVALMKKCGKFVVCDRGNERSRMQIFTKNGHFVRKISIRYIDIVAGLAVTADGHIVAVDSVSPTVFVLAENGNLLRWFDCSDYMREPSDIAISGDEFFVCDFKGHCVVVFNMDGKFQRRIGGESVTNYPNGIDVSDAGDVLVGDSHGNRFHVTVFSRDGHVLSDVECPAVKVSRCCGLKLTSEGLIVTLAKNNHHVLILSTIFVQ